MFDLEGERIRTAQRGYALEIWTEGGWLIRAETTVQVMTSDGVREVPTPAEEPEVDARLEAEVESLVGRTIAGTRSVAGRLVVDLGEVSLLVDPDPDHEAWQLVGPEQQRVICLPGGELSGYS